MGQLPGGCSGGDTATATPGISSSRMQLTILILSLAHYGALGAPVGAMESSVAQGGLNIPSLGAPRTFDLFYPELPTLRPVKETTTAVPVIYLQENEKIVTMDKATSDAYLEMFPQDLLDSNTEIRPIDVRIIEHDGFIDYEIEFIEMSEEQSDEYDINDNKDAPDNKESDFTFTEMTTEKILTTTPTSTYTVLNAVNFVDLIQSARWKHRNKVSQKEQEKQATKRYEGQTESSSSFESGNGLDMSITQPMSSKTLYEQPRTNLNKRNKVRKTNKASITRLVKQQTPDLRQLVSKHIGDATSIKSLNAGKIYNKFGISSTFRPSKLIEDNGYDSEMENILLNSKLLKEIKPYDIPSTTIKTYMQSSTTPSMPSYHHTLTSSIFTHEPQSSTSSSISSSAQSSLSSNLSSYQESPSMTTMKSYQELTTSGWAIMNERETTNVRFSMRPLDTTGESVSEEEIKETATKLPLIDEESTGSSSYEESPPTTIMKSYNEATTSEPSSVNCDNNTKQPEPTTMSPVEELKDELITMSYGLPSKYSEKMNKESTTSSMRDAKLNFDEEENLNFSEAIEAKDVPTSEESSTVINERFIPSKIMAKYNGEDIEESKRRQPEEKVKELSELSDSIQIIIYETTLSSMHETTTEPTNSQPERSPKRIDSKVSLSQLLGESASFRGLKTSKTVPPSEVIKGQYHEISPGQYHEMYPGQYDRVNSGGQDLGVENVIVDFDHEDESRIYNVQANAGDFIIGEVGRIDINSGQTFQGVRYTAVEGEIDQAQIADILERYFGAGTS